MVLTTGSTNVGFVFPYLDMPTNISNLLKVERVRSKSFAR